MAVKFTQKLFDEICERIANGESLTQICKAEDMPAKSAVVQWTLKNQSLAEQYARAREQQADSLADEILDEARKETFPEHVQNKRLLIDALKWRAGKLKPKVYGDKVENTVTGPNGGPLQIQKIENVIVDPANPDS